VYPAYQGASILNLPATICRLLGAPKLGAPELGAGPLSAELLAKLGGPYRRVILVLVDALGLKRFQNWVRPGIAPIWGQLVENGWLAPLTSIVPSTTAAALTSLWTGRSAAEHAITGYEMWLKEYGMVVNAITHHPMSYGEGAGGLIKAGFNPEAFLPFPGLGSHLLAHGVKSYAFQHQSILHSTFSKMFLKDVNLRAFFTASDLWINVRQLLEGRSHERQYVYVYWAGVDVFSHHHGPDDERTVADFRLFSAAFEQSFLSRLTSEARRETLLLLTADHGMLPTPLNPHYELRNHPNLARRLHIQPCGENRLAYFYIRPGQVEAVREYLQRAWPNQFVQLDPAYAVESGLFGPGAPHLRLLERLGDLIAAARGGAYFWWAQKDNPLLGRHGGLHPEEMIVPFLAVQL
jgi:hypothetical protein